MTSTTSDSLLFLTLDEILDTGVTWKEGGDFLNGQPPVLLGVMIVTTLPPQFVRNQEEFTMDNYSLAREAVEEIMKGNAYHHLMSLDMWAEMNVLHQSFPSVEEKAQPYAGEFAHLPLRQQIFYLVKTLLVLVSTHTIETDILATPGESSYEAQDVAYAWLKTHWTSVRGLLSVMYRQAKNWETVPPPEARCCTSLEFVIILHDVLVLHMGLACKLDPIASSLECACLPPQEDYDGPVWCTCNPSSRLRYTVTIKQVSCWAALDVDVAGWIRWIAADRPTLGGSTYGTVPLGRGQCGLCARSAVCNLIQDCWTQRGILVCKRHRVVTAPLDMAMVVY
jgi:hypothetical protein